MLPWCVSCWLGCGGCWSRLWRGRGIDAGAHQKKEIDQQDCDEDEAADEDVGFEAHHGFVAGKIRRWNVFVLVVALVLVFGHAHKLTWHCVHPLPGRKIFFRGEVLRGDG